jgi:hypothetical protein
MDPAQVRELRGWATRLEDAASEELRAAGRAIRMLVDEVEGLQSRLAQAERARPAPAAAPQAEEPEAEPDEESAEPAWAKADDRLQGSFFSRLKRSFGFD